MELAEMTLEARCVLASMLLVSVRDRWTWTILSQACEYSAKHGLPRLLASRVQDAIFRLELDGLVQRGLLGNSLTGPYKLTFEGWVMANKVHGRE
jgi:hypothetical protein